jgi:hypothetical protein
MANCSIPNSSPASGRISTRSLRRSRKQNSQPRASVSVIRRSASRLQERRRVRHLESVRWQTAAFKSRTAARKIQSAICNRQSAIRRVKGAWWPSRSSKPSSPRKWRGRFDSYPLRQIIFDSRLPIADCPGTGRMISIANRNSKIENWLKGGDTNVA